MSIQRWLAAGLLVALVAPGAAQDTKPQDTKPQEPKPQEPKPVKLEWKFEKEKDKDTYKTFYQTVVIEARHPAKPMDKEAKPEGGKPEGGKPDSAKPDAAKPDQGEPDSSQTFYLSWEPLKPEDKGWLLKMKIEGVKVRFTVGGTTVAYDSTKDEKPNGVLPVFYSKLVGAELTFTITSEMQATKVEVKPELLKELKKANPQLEKLVDQALSETALFPLTDLSFPYLAKQEVKKGVTWLGRNTELSLDFLGTYTIKYTFTDEGPEADANREKISIKGDVTYAEGKSLLPPLPDSPKLPSGSPFTVTKADWKTHEVSGTIDFRKDKNRVEKLTQTLTLQGTLTIDIGGRTNDVDVNLVRTTTVTTSDENPVKKK